MAKKGLKKPDLPVGARLDFFLLLQRLVVDHGDQTAKDLAAKVTCSPQAVHKALIGPKVPGRDMTTRLVAALTTDVKEQAAVERAWQEAVKEERGLVNAVASTKASGSDDPRRALFTEKFEQLARSVGHTKWLAAKTDTPRSTLYSWRKGTNVPSTAGFYTFIKRANSVDEISDDQKMLMLDAYSALVGAEDAERREMLEKSGATEMTFSFDDGLGTQLSRKWTLDS